MIAAGAAVGAGALVGDTAGLPALLVSDGSGDGADAIQTYIYPLLRDPDALRHYRTQPWALPLGYAPPKPAGRNAE